MPARIAAAAAIAAHTHTLLHAYARMYIVEVQFMEGSWEVEEKVSEATVADVGELGLEPLEAAADGGLEPGLRREHVVRRHPPPPLRLRVLAGAGAVEAVRLDRRAAPAHVLVVVPAAAPVVRRRGVLVRHRSALLHGHRRAASSLLLMMVVVCVVWERGKNAEA